MPTIHELTGYFADDEAGYPKPVERKQLGIFTTLGRAENYMLDLLVSDKGALWGRDSLVCLTLEELPLDVEPSFLCRRTYDAAGNFRGEVTAAKLSQPFHGRDPAACQFARGEFVEFICGNRLEVGIVAGLPLSPDEAAHFTQSWEVLGDEDCYLVYLGADDHAHIPEPELFKPTAHIDDTASELLLARLGAYFPNLPDQKAVSVLNEFEHADPGEQNQLVAARIRTRAGMARGTVVLDADLAVLGDALSGANILVVVLPSDVDEDSLKRLYLPGRILIARHLPDLHDAAVYEYGIVSLRNLGFIDHSPTFEQNQTAQQISRVLSQYALWVRGARFFLELKDDGNHVLKELA